MTDSDPDDLSAFKKFIEESLDLAGLGERADQPLLPAPMRFNPNLSNYDLFKQDIQQAWKALHRKRPAGRCGDLS